MSQTSPRFDLPTIEDDTRPYWDALREGRLTIGHCNGCDRNFYYPRPFCPSCWSDDVALVETSGRATLYTYSIVHANDLPPFRDWLPYVAAVVDLEEGVRISTNIVDCPADRLAIGMKLVLGTRAATDEISVPVFRPAEDANGPTDIAGQEGAAS